MPNRYARALLLAIATLAVASCGDSTAPDNPSPVVTSLTPDVVLWLSTSAEVTVRGSGFVAASLVLVDDIVRPATLVSSTEMRLPLLESDFQTPRVLKIGVYNPSPGGGRSALKELDVRLPPPALTGLSVTTTETRTTDLVVRLTGTGFTPTSVAYVNQAPRTTTWIDWRALDVVVPASYLASPGVLEFTVMNPGPGGGPTPPLQLQVVEAVPVVTELSSSGATAGGGGFALSVLGRAFAPNSVVLWNGAPRATEFISRGRLVAAIAASDVAGAGTAQVTVTTPAPGGGASNAKSLTVRTVGAPVATKADAVPLRARDIAVDRTRSLIYLSIPSVSPVDANNIIAVDPATGAVTKRVLVGGGPTRLAISDDAQYLYAGLDEARAVRRVVLSSFTASLQWALPAGQVAGELLVLPGRPSDVVVARSDLQGNVSVQGVTVFDNGVARSQGAPGRHGVRLAITSSADTAYAYNHMSTGFEFMALALGPAGASYVSTTPGLVSGFATHITGAGGRVYATDGSVVDPARLAKAGSFPLDAQAAGIGVDADLGRAFFAVPGGISVYDINTFRLLGTVAVPGVAHAPLPNSNGRVLRWGSDGVAFIGMDYLYIVRSPLFGP